MEGKDFDYRREGWQRSAAAPGSAPSYAPSSSSSRRLLLRRQSWPVWLAHRFLEAILVATCLVVSVASFFAAVIVANNEESAATFSTAMSCMMGGFVALVAAMTRFGWLLVLSVLPSIFAFSVQEYYNDSGNENLVNLTYFFDVCVVAIAVGLVVARCSQPQSSVDAEDDEDVGIQARSPTRRTPMIREIV